ncbi:MAG: alpha-L-fucosidase [Clostridiales bacterium]|nr:alpha-L-fucosidase [Clostridiales bacterium]
MRKFEANFESLYAHQTPEWFLNAKFGIWSHWGPQSTPMYGDWYARNMYIEGSDQYKYHLRHYGHPSTFGFKDICHLWKAENFDPEELMSLYVNAGAKYFVAQAMHHDHFFNYPSKLNPMNSVEVGPHKDIVGLWHKAAKKHHLPFGLTEHLGASFSWWRVNKGCDQYGAYAGVPYDGNNPAYQHFYHDNKGYCKNLGDTSTTPWYTADAAFQAYWLACMKELIDAYSPELLYSDGALPFGPHWENLERCADASHYQDGLEAVAYLYNTSIEKYGKNQAIYTQKDRNPHVYRVGVLDIEKSQLDGIQKHPWQTDTCIGNWFYDVRQDYKRPDQIIDMLADIVSKNGSMLLNILQRPDGTIDAEARYILRELAGWMKERGESIHDTHPWKRYGEGETHVKIDGFTEEKTNWGSSDIRYTQKGNTVYAFLMGEPQNHRAVLRSFNEGEEIHDVRLLGVGKVDFSHALGVLVVDLSETLPTQYVNVLAIDLK